MRRKRLWIVLTLALLTGGLAGWLALDYMRSTTRTAAAPEQASEGEVVVAARDLAAGAIVGPEDVKMVEWPAGAISPAYARSEDDVVGRGVIQPVSADEPILQNKLAGEGAGGGLPVVIPDGMRAVSVKVDEVIAVAGFVLPTTFVDVIVTMDPASGEAQATSKVVLQNVEVIAAGQTMERDASGAPQNVPVITLLVTPEEAEKLALASAEGRIQLALRNTMDREEVETPGIEANNLVRTASTAPPQRSRPAVRRAPRPDPGFTVETFDGTDRKVTKF